MELLTVVGIIMILLGAAMSGLSTLISRTSYYSGINAHLNIHTTLSSLARKAGNSGRVYGYRLNFTSISSQAAGSTIYPWYRDNGGSQTFFTSGGEMNNVTGISLDAVADSQSTPNFYYDITDKILASQAAAAGSAPDYKKSYWLNGTASSSAYSTSTFFTFSFEPGTGYLHVTRDSSSLTTISAMVSTTPDLIEFNYYSLSRGTASRRLILYQNGSAEIKGVR